MNLLLWQYTNRASVERFQIFLLLQKYASYDINVYFFSSRIHNLEDLLKVDI